MNAQELMILLEEYEEIRPKTIEDLICDDIQHMLEETRLAHIFMSAVNAYSLVHGENMDFDKFVHEMFAVGHAAKFHEWPAGVAEAMRTFCVLARIDPALIEVYIGLRLEEVAKHIL